MSIINYNRLVSRIRYAMSQYADCSIEEIPMNAHIEHDIQHPFGAYDELSFVEFLMVLEEEMDLNLDQEIDERINRLKTVQQFADYIHDLNSCAFNNRSHPLLDNVKGKSHHSFIGGVKHA